MDPLHRLYAYHSAYKLNPAVMREAAKHFIGNHDFSSFANASRDDRVPDPVKIIFRFDVIEMVIEFQSWEIFALKILIEFFKPIC